MLRIWPARRGNTDVGVGHLLLGERGAPYIVAISDGTAFWPDADPPLPSCPASSRLMLIWLSCRLP